MKSDIKTRKDIKLMVDRFYEKVKADETIGYLFNDVAKVNWEHHLPRMYDFWENIIFQTGSFSGNPMAAHLKLHQQSPLNAAHFERWLKLFNTNMDELFQGELADLTKRRAASIAMMMQGKVTGTFG
jgi:hemoglobin